MSAPSFTSFPDFDSELSKARPSSPHRDPSKDKKKRDKGPKSGHSSKQKDKEKGKEKLTQHEGSKRKHKHRGEREQRPDDETRRQLLDDDDSYRLFFSDRRPDMLNVQYGGLHAGDVPKYRIIAGGRHVLGLPKALTVVRRAGKGIEIGVNAHRKLSNLTDSRTRSLLALPPTRTLLHSDQPGKYQEVDGFIGLPTRGKKHAPEDTYRSITDPKDEDDSSSDSDESTQSIEESDSDGEENSTLPESSQQAQIRTLEQQLAAKPESVETWISLLDHTLSSVPITSKNATKARCEITTAVLSRALSAHPHNGSSKILRIKYLKAGEEIWHESKLRSEWEEALKVGGIELWMEWLEWRLRQGHKRVDGFLEDITRAFAAFGGDEESEIAKLRIFWRAAVGIKDAGFSERAMAMFQAQLELTFNLPEQLSSSPFHQQLDELEDFWESETPRIGEEGARGWKAWYDQGKPDLAYDTSAASSTNLPDILDLDPYRQWAAQESAADRRLLLPTRTAESEDLDPYSTVLFADIRPTIFTVHSGRTKHALRLALLSFVKLHLPGFSQSLSHTRTIDWDDRWSLSTLSEPSRLQAILPTDTQRRPVMAESVAGVVVAHEKGYSSSFGPIKNWGYGVFHPLDVALTRLDSSQQRLWDSLDVEHVDQSLMRRIFSQLRVGGDLEWDSLALAFEAALSIRNALKLSKAFLSASQNSLEYWAAHAQLERIHGRPDGARKVYQTVLIASKPKPSQQGFSQLWWNWAELEWLAGQGEQALNVVLRSVGIEGPKATEISVLRAKRLLDDFISSASLWKDKENWIKLRALLELLKGADMKDVISIFDDRRQRLEKGALPHESLTVASLLIVYYHRVVLKNPMPPAVLRERSEEALEEYPSNSVILGIFLEGEKGQGIWGKVRGMLGASDGKSKDVARRAEEVWIAGWEKGRWLGEIERTRNGLAAAVEHERTRASPVIWRLYLEFEIKAGQLQTAKKLLFRAIGECPLVKELYLLAFGPLRGVFDARELHSFADLMAERGLRLRKGLEEAVDVGDVGGPRLEYNGMEGDAIEDEIEHNARELRRLMPY